MKNNIKLIDDEVLIKEYIERGKRLFEDRQFEKAFRYYNKAILLDNEYAETYFVKGHAHLQRFEAEEAESCLKMHLKLAPNEPKGYWKLIELHDLTGDFDKCIYYCEKLIEMDPTNSKTYLKKAEFLALLNDFNEAIKCFDICLKLDSNFYDAMCGKASALLSLRNKKDALALYIKATYADITKSAAYFGTSAVYMSMGYFQKALIFAEKAYNIEPDNEWYKCHYSVLKNMSVGIR